jgi:predicted transcriptional regulator
MKNHLVTNKKTVEVIDHAKTGSGLRSARKAQRVSLRSLAAQMSLSAPYISDLENGRRNWSTLLVNKYHEALTTFKIRGIQKAIAHKGPNLFIGSKS